jgi:DNA (cytosine-5)-methyltransferase 1
MNHISLFSGIGGFELASEWIGWNNIASCEINPFGNKVLEYYWPNALHHDDVKTFTKKLLDEKIKDWDSNDVILTGGFPCQPYSNAGKRKGKDDERHLWPEMLRVIQEIKPRWIVGENVRGLINWNGGMVFDEVQTDLENSGYEVQPFILPACSKNAPHRRDRIWFVAYSNGSGKGNNGGSNKGEAKEIRGKEKGNVSAKLCSIGNATNSDSKRQSSKEYREKESRRVAKESISANWQNFPTQSPICGGNDGISTELDGITFPKWRNESIKAYGNAVVPQVVFEIFKAIEKYEQIKKDS